MPDLEPITRLEEYLSKLAGDDVAVPEPITRVEKFLAYIAGEADSKPTPITRIEKFLDAIGQGGGGGETVIVPEQEVTTADYDGWYYTFLAGDFVIPEAGDTVVATFDGIDYTLTAIDLGGVIGIGEVSGDFPDFTNYPFMIAIMDTSTAFINMQTDVPHTVKVTKQGGSAPVLIDKTITSNGTYNASSDSADGYKKVVANVANTYTAGDEGKVVSSGALVSQTAATYTANSVYDTTLIDEVTVNVSGGGGGLTLLATDEVTVNTSSTSATDVKTLSVPTAWMADKILMVVVKDKAGLRSGYFYSSMRIISNDSAKRGITSAVNQFAGNIVYETAGGTITAGSGNYGVYSKSLASDGTITISARYNSAYGTIDGTYEIKVYAIDIDPFA